MADANAPVSPTFRLAEDYTVTAGDYAALWGPAILPAALPLLDAFPLGSCRRVLDLGAGVGGLVPHVRAKAAGAQIVAADRSEGMLRQAQARGHSGLVVLDAQELALGERIFDAVLLVFMLFHLPNPGAALREARRVLRPGSFFAATTWAQDPGLPGREIWTEVLDRHGAEADPRDASVRQHTLMDSPAKVARLLSDAGLAPVTIWTERYERRWDYESLVALQQACGVAGRRLAQLPPAMRTGCTVEVRERLAALPEAALVWRPDVLYAVARRPEGD